MKLKKTRRMATLSSGRSKRRAPLFALIGIAVTLLVVVGAGAIFVLPRLVKSHADSTNTNCTLLVPANPLSAQGLATPYQLSATDPAAGPCNEANTAQSAFVQAVIYNPSTGAFSVYSPLVIDANTQPAVAPVVPTLPRRAVVGIWFGFNANNLTLKGAQRGTLWQASCVNGLGNSLFTQFAYCNAVDFFNAANQGIRRGLVKVPALQTANDGQACPTTRDFAIIDQDQSDNVQTQYLANANGQTAQLSTANQAQLQGANTLGNPSDNALVTHFMDPVLGCTPWTAPDLANNNAPVADLAMDELQAAADQTAPVALVPVNDPMTTVNGNTSITKTNLYRAGVDQPLIRSQRQAQSNGATYCQNMINVAIPRLTLDQTAEQAAASPDPGAANSLFTFLGQRLQGSYDNLGCAALLNKPNPITTQVDGNGVATAVTFATTTTTAPAATPTSVPTTTAPAATPTAPAGTTPIPTTTPAVTPTVAATPNQ